MLRELEQRARTGKPIRIALVGAGAMGLGIAWQIGHTPGMVLAAVTDLDIAAARRAARAHGGDFIEAENMPLAADEGKAVVSREAFYLARGDNDLKIDVLVEATNTIGFAARACLLALRLGIHVVLMNAEVDLQFGPLLLDEAGRNGVVVTSDAGDQHGVLLRMIDEIRLWAFDIKMAGNIKGFLDRYATPESVLREARIRDLNPVQCCAYTDGTKLNVEMALVANGTGLKPWVKGMEGPLAKDVTEVLHLFDFDRYGDQGVVDYILGANPGGGVFVVGQCTDPLQRKYLKYYKMGSGPNYLFYRPYHLCHLETIHAIASAVIDRRPILTAAQGRVADVYAYAKRDLEAGEYVREAIGGDQFYGLVERCRSADSAGKMPLCPLEPEPRRAHRIKRRISRDSPVFRDDIELAETAVVKIWHNYRKSEPPEV